MKQIISPPDDTSDRPTPDVRPLKRKRPRKKSKSGAAALEWNVRRASGLLEAFRELIDLMPALTALPVEQPGHSRRP